MKKPLRLGIIGAGAIAQRAPMAHLALGDYRDRVTLQAVCDPVAGRAQAAADKFGIARAFQSEAELIRHGDVDLVTVCSPIGLHFKHGMLAIKAGKHVHFNKTMCTTKKEADTMIAAAKKRKVRLVVSPGQMLRPQNQRIRKLVREGAIGKVCWAAIGSAFGNYHQEEGVRTGKDVLSNVNPSWYFRRPGGGPLYDMTVYGLTSLTGVLGPARGVAAISGVFLKTRTFQGKPVACDADDNTFMVLDFGGSTSAFVYGAAEGWLVPSLDFPTYFGTSGSIEQMKLNGKPFDYPGRERDNGNGAVLTPHIKGKHVGLGEEHVFEDIMQLVRWVREGVPSLATAEHGRHIVDIFESAYRSAKTGKAQRLSTTFTLTPGA